MQIMKMDWHIEILINIYYIKIATEYFSMHGNTYSLKAILQSDLDPTLCKLMLHQIKSPLLQHSFQLTTDDQYNSGSVTLQNCSGYNRNKYTEQISSRDKEKQKIDLNKKQAEFQRMHQRLNQMSVVMSEHQTSRKYQRAKQKIRYHTKTDSQQQNKNVKHKQNRLINQTQAYDLLHFVSPLEYNHNMLINSRNSSQNYVKQKQNLFILEQEIENNKFVSSYQNSMENGGVDKWCGEIFDTRNAYENQLIFDDAQVRSFIRKKIFPDKPKDNTKIMNKNIPKIQYISFNQSIHKLQSINEPQLARFIQLLHSCLCMVQNLPPYRTNLSSNQPILYKILLTDNPVDHTPRQTISNKNRILNRLQVTKMSQALNKIIELNDKQNKKMCGRQNTQQLQQKIQSNVSKVLQIYSQIEDNIEDYVSRDNIVYQLTQIYNLLYQKQIAYLQLDEQNSKYINSPVAKLEQKNNKQIYKSLIQTPIIKQSLKQKLQKLLISLKIDPQCYRNLQQLAYIWTLINVPEGYSPISTFKYKINKQKFINEICRNDIVIHQANKRITQLQIQKKLTMMGFTRNIDGSI